MFSLLYVDDEPGLLEIGQLFLESTGEFSVTPVLSGKEALAQFAQHDFDAIVADYQMPEMDGLDLLKSVRKSFGNVPFILFTGRGREEIVIEAINNGADFYLQKGGDPQAQFAELAHKIRQAVSRRRAEIALSDSEKRHADLINFLPDATFAIDSGGEVIAWNKAIEEMTGIPAADMLGKGDYEYALPFYGIRRPILVDLIFESDAKVAENYSNILRDGKTLSAETSLPHPKGRQIHVLAKASPLYNREGEIIGAIEAIRDITDRKKSEEELRAANEQLAASGEELRVQYDELAEGDKRIRESEVKFRNIIENSPIGMHFYELMPDGSLVFTGANPGADKILGMKHNKFVGKTIEDAFPDLIATEVPAQYRRVASEGVVWETDQVIHDTGNIHGTYSVTAFQVSPGSIVAMFVDITERKRSENELRAAYEQVAAADEELRSQYDELAAAQGSLMQQENLLENTFSSIRDGISILDRTMTITRTNKTMEEWYSHEMPLIGKKCWVAYHGRTERCESCPSYRTLRTGMPEKERVPLVDAGQTVGSLDLYSYPLIDSVTGEMTGVIEYVRDISEEKRAQDELREKSEELDRFFTMSLDLFCIADTDGNFIHLNPAWERTLGYSLTELEGQRFLDFVHPDDLPATLAAVADLNGQKEVLDFTNRYRCKDGSYRWIEWRSRAKGKLVYAVAQDITERKRMEEALRESEEKYRLIS